ncbi:MAG: hypothetical protein HUU20_05870 [Pirellulales bacterium]|nr:hypothetical protein [Pirellulales bacterium]
MTQDRGKTDTLSEKAEAAFRQAAAKVVRRARETGTPVIVWKEGRIVEIPSEQVELAAADDGADDPGNVRTDG